MSLERWNVKDSITTALINMLFAAHHTVAELFTSKYPHLFRFRIIIDISVESIQKPREASAGEVAVGICAGEAIAVESIEVEALGS